MGLDVVAWSDDLRDQVLDILGPIRHWTMEQGRTLWRPSTGGDRWSRAVVLLDAGRPVAAAGALHPRLHPANEWAYVEVTEGRRRQGIGSRALAELRRTLPHTAGPLKAKVEAATAGSAFAAQHGMTVIQRTRMIKVTGVPDEAASTEVDITSALDATAVSAWRDFYLNGHTWDPPADVESGVWRELLAGTQQIARVRRRDAVVGIALVLSHNGGLRFAGGALRRDDPDALRIARDLLLGVSAALGGTGFVVEVDDWMQEIDTALQGFSIEALDESQLVVEVRSPRRVVEGP